MSRYSRYWKRIRRARELEQKDISQKLGLISPQFISNVETGRCRYSIPQVKKLVGILELNVDEVVEFLMMEEESLVRRQLKIKKNCGSD